MTLRLLSLFALFAFAAGCRTTIAPYKRPDPKVVYVGDKTCNVYDFNSATDVPDGAKSLGWIEVPNAANDEETFVALHQKVCEMGGDAVSQIAWVHETGKYEPVGLKGNVWSLP